MNALEPQSTSTRQLAKRDALDVYIQQSKRFPLLSHDEVHGLAVRVAEQGDSQAARRLVESNLRLVVKIAFGYRRAHHNLLDLVQEGNIGLIRAVSKYDPYRGVKLSTYAGMWIRAYILKYIVDNHRLVKLGTTQAQRKLFFNLSKERDKLEAQGFNADSASLAKALDVKESEIIEMQKRLGASDASFDAPLVSPGDDGVRTRHDLVADLPAERPDELVEESQFQARLKQVLASFANTLEGREERIFRQRWLTDNPMMLRELGSEFGVSRERTRQIEKRLLGRVRNHLIKELGTAVEIGMNQRMAA